MAHIVPKSLTSWKSNRRIPCRYSHLINFRFMGYIDDNDQIYLAQLLSQTLSCRQIHSFLGLEDSRTAQKQTMSEYCGKAMVIIKIGGNIICNRYRTNDTVEDNNDPMIKMVNRSQLVLLPVPLPFHPSSYNITLDSSTNDDDETIFRIVTKSMYANGFRACMEAMECGKTGKFDQFVNLLKQFKYIVEY